MHSKAFQNKNITIVAYEEMQFIDAPASKVSYKDIISDRIDHIIILGLLGFVVFMSLRNQERSRGKRKNSPVEDLLQSTQAGKSSKA